MDETGNLDQIRFATVESAVEVLRSATDQTVVAVEIPDHLKTIGQVTGYLDYRVRKADFKISRRWNSGESWDIALLAKGSFPGAPRMNPEFEYRVVLFDNGSRLPARRLICGRRADGKAIGKIDDCNDGKLACVARSGEASAEIEWVSVGIYTSERSAKIALESELERLATKQQDDPAQSDEILKVRTAEPTSAVIADNVLTCGDMAKYPKATELFNHLL